MKLLKVTITYVLNSDEVASLSKARAVIYSDENAAFILDVLEADVDSSALALMLFDRAEYVQVEGFTPVKTVQSLRLQIVKAHRRALKEFLGEGEWRSVNV